MFLTQTCNGKDFEKAQIKTCSVFSNRQRMFLLKTIRDKTTNAGLQQHENLDPNDPP